MDIRNAAESTVFQSEKTLGEIGDKIPASELQPVREQIDKVKELLKGEDTQAIKEATDELTKRFYAVSEKLYQQQAPQGDAGAQQDPGASSGPQQGADGGQYYDADYKVVDDDDKK